MESKAKRNTRIRELEQGSAAPTTSPDLLESLVEFAADTWARAVYGGRYSSPSVIRNEEWLRTCCKAWLAQHQVCGPTAETVRVAYLTNTPEHFDEWYRSRVRSIAEVTAEREKRLDAAECQAGASMVEAVEQIKSDREDLREAIRLKDEELAYLQQRLREAEDAKLSKREQVALAILSGNETIPNDQVCPSGMSIGEWQQAVMNQSVRYAFELADAFLKASRKENRQ